MNSSSARIGYARISTADQNLDAQTAALQAAGCTMVRTETGDGTTLAGRPEPGTILEFIHPGETLVVTRSDRLALPCPHKSGWTKPLASSIDNVGRGVIRCREARICAP